MRKLIGAVSFAMLLFASPALFAQATRTWVSGVGDDANPCSRTAPCKTFAGAISKTAAGGEISVLDPGGYGAVNITKSITINGEGTLAGILSSSTNGVIVNGSGIVVNLVNLSFNGGSTSAPGLNGVRIIQAASVSVDRCDIFNFSQAGISDERTTAGTLTVRNTRIHNSLGAGPNSAGISLYPSSGTPALRLLIEESEIFSMPQSNSMGIVVANGGSAEIRKTSISGTAHGLFVYGSAAAAVANVTDSVFFNNGSGVRVTSGATARLASTTITGSTTNALEIYSGTIESFGNNYIAGNAGNNGSGMTPVNMQ